MRKCLVLFFLCVISQSVHAQATASLVLMHDDPDGIVEPGQAVTMRVRASWTQGWMLAVIGGHSQASPDAGVASNPISGFAPSFGGASTSHGQAVLGSIRDFGAGVAPGSQSYPSIYAAGWSGMDALTYTWTAPSASQAGVYNFTFEFSTPDPSIYLYLGDPSVLPILPANTSLTGTTLTVVPSPPTMVLVGAFAGLLRRRR